MCNPETIIYTTEGPKQIQECEYGSTGIATNGKETIENVLKHSYEGEIYEIETMDNFRTITYY